MYGKPIDSIGFVNNFDPELASMMNREFGRQQDGLELIASENFASTAVMAAMGSILTNKYAEVGLGVNAGVVEYLLTSGNTEEACALGEGLIADLGNLLKLRYGAEFAVFLSVLNDILRCGRIDTRNVRKERIGRGIEVNSDRVYTVLNNSAECLVKSVLLHIVLILTNADRLWLDLNKLGEGILKSSCD